MLKEISASLGLRDSSFGGYLSPECSTLKLTFRSWAGLTFSFTSVFAIEAATEAATDTEEARAEN